MVPILQKQTKQNIEQNKIKQNNEIYLFIKLPNLVTLRDAIVIKTRGTYVVIERSEKIRMLLEKQ